MVKLESYKLGEFYIQKIENSLSCPIMQVSGYIGTLSDGTKIGFHFSKDNSLCIATDIESGCALCKYPTPEECLDWISDNYARIEDRKLTFDYDYRVNRFKMLCEELL